MRFIKCTLVFFTICIASCYEPQEFPESEFDDYEIPELTPSGDENFMNLDSDYIFDQDSLYTFELKMPSQHLRQLDLNPAAEEYVEGSLHFKGETVSPVGIRYKGSIGAFVGCTSGNNIFDPSGVKTCPKLSMKVKINWNGSDTKFFGLKKLQFHAMNLDPSQMRERLGYALFREMGVPAPRCVHARLVINGQFVGIFALVEQIDGRFTRHNFDDGEGNLYKEIWPIDSNGDPFTTSQYLQALKTNEDESPSVALIQNFGQEIKNAAEADMKEVVSKWMDIEKIIPYAVVDRTIKNDDGAFHWYCNNGTCAPHNFYWYEETDREKLHLIVWDLDNAFENISNNGNAVTKVIDEWGETSNNCEPFSQGVFGIEQKSAACDKLTAAWVSFEDQFTTTKIQFLNGPFSEENVNEKLDTWSAQIFNATMEAQNMNDSAITVSFWEGAVSRLKDQCDIARNN